MFALIPRLLLCLTLGLLSTIAIAWLSAAFAPLTRTSFQQIQVLDEDGHGPVAFIESAARPGLARFRLTSAAGAWPRDPDPNPNAAAARTILVLLPPGFPPRWTGPLDAADVEGHAPGDVEWMQDARGWPMLALRCEWIGRGSPARPAPPRGGLALPSASRMPMLARALPYRPIPLGLAADTLIFALAWSALLTAPRLIRTRYRRRRNLCPRCAYNLAGLPPNSPCPECGPVPRASPHA